MTVQTPQYLQNKAYGARSDRQVVADVFQAGVMGITDLKVITLGTTRQVYASAGEGYVLGNTVANQGLYRVFNDTNLTLTHDAAVSNPRIDQIVLRVYDSFEAGNSGSDQGTIEIVKGTEAAGATLDNRTGAVADASLPKNVLRLADVLVTVGVGAIPAGNIRDRRTWARGAFSMVTSATNLAGSGGAQKQVACSTTVEIGNNPVRLTGQLFSLDVGSGVPAYGVRADFWVDGIEFIMAYPGKFSESNEVYRLRGNTFDKIVTPGAGRHLFEWGAYLDNAGVGGISIAQPFQLTVEEIVRQNSGN